jgi:hypothetical protein
VLDISPVSKEAEVMLGRTNYKVPYLDSFKAMLSNFEQVCATGLESPRPKQGVRVPQGEHKPRLLAASFVFSLATAPDIPHPRCISTYTKSCGFQTRISPRRAREKR